MHDDDVFRFILIAGFLVFMPIGVYHRVKSRTGEKLDRRRFQGHPAHDADRK